MKKMVVILLKGFTLSCGFKVLVSIMSLMVSVFHNAKDIQICLVLGNSNSG